MSQQEFYETVQREQEWEHDMKLKTFADNIREELNKSDELYCCYCSTPKGEKWHCCQENHFVGFSELDDDSQKYLIQEQIDEYERLTK
jgi:hypothetical protein